MAGGRFAFTDVKLNLTKASFSNSRSITLTVFSALIKS